MRRRAPKPKGTAVALAPGPRNQCTPRALPKGRLHSRPSLLPPSARLSVDRRGLLPGAVPHTCTVRKGAPDELSNHPPANRHPCRRPIRACHAPRGTARPGPAGFRLRLEAAHGADMLRRLQTLPAVPVRTAAAASKYSDVLRESYSFDDPEYLANADHRYDQLIDSRVR